VHIRPRSANQYTRDVYTVCGAARTLSAKAIKIIGRRDSTVSVTVVPIKFKINLRTKTRQTEVHFLIKNRKNCYDGSSFGQTDSKTH